MTIAKDIRVPDCDLAIGYAWCAGFFEGEGCTHLAKAPSRKPRLRVQLTQADPEVLLRFLAHMRIEARVRGPYNASTPSQKSKKPRWVLVYTGPKATEILTRMWPYMGEVKRTQAKDAGYVYFG